MAYGARLESVLGASPRGFESPILRHHRGAKGNIVSNAHDAPLVVRPRRRLLRDGLLAIGLVLGALVVPLLFFAIPSGDLVVVVGAGLAVAALTAAGVADYSRSSVTVAGHALFKRSFLAQPLRVELADIAAVHLVEVYISGTTQTVPQLLALDEDGRRLFRMRGQYWTRHGMALVAAATGATVIETTEALTQREFHAAWPQAAYWYENRPGLAALGFVGVLIAAAAIVYGMLALAGVPVTGS